MNNSTDPYQALETILAEAHSQASKGKGKDRHALDGERFEDQQICEIGRRLKGNPAAGPLFQAVKKVYESGRLGGEAGVRELLGSINYIVAGVILLREDEAERDGGTVQITAQEIDTALRNAHRNDHLGSSDC